MDGAKLTDFLPELNYDLESPEERNQLITEMFEDTHFFQQYFGKHFDPSTHTSDELAACKVLEALATYIIIAKDKEVKKEKDYLYKGREQTIKNREYSLEKMADCFPNGMDGVEKFVRNDKNIIMRPKDSISKEDCENIPELKVLVDEINRINEKLKNQTWSGREEKKVKKMLIELRKDQYILREAYKRPIRFNKIYKSASKIQFDQDTGYYTPSGAYHLVSENKLDLKNWKHVKGLLRNYAKLRDACFEDSQSDMAHILMDLEKITNKALVGKYSYYKDILVAKIDKLSNEEIQQLLLENQNKEISEQYISTLFNNNIPKTIAKQAQLDYELWYYTQVEKAKFKKCNRCGQLKLANGDYFSKNKSSSDGFYSICKECRSKK